MSDEQAAKKRLDSRLAHLFASDSQFSAAAPLATVAERVAQTQTLLSTVATLMDGYADRPALGWRKRARDPQTQSPDPTSLLPELETMSYGEVWEHSGALAAALHHDLSRPVRPGEFVCFLGFTSPEYVLLDFACLQLGAVAAPLQSSTSVAQLLPIVREVAPRVIATSIDDVDRAIELARAMPETPRVVVFDVVSEAGAHRDVLAQALERLGPDATGPIDSLQTLLSRGRQLPPVAREASEAEDDLRLVIYTSGSTGSPKGAMYTGRMIRNWWTGNIFQGNKAKLPAIGLNYMPLSHIGGRASLAGTLGRGGTSYFTGQSDLSTLFEDMALVRPTELLFVPRVCNMLHHNFRSELEQRSGDDGDEARLKQEFRTRRLGGRVLDITSSSAPLSDDVAAFMESCLELKLHNGYGSTEAGGIVVNSQVRRPPVLDYKLQDVPELGYFKTDTPHPRGELLVKTRDIFPGYYKRPELTAAAFDDEGFYRTGDIMAETGPDRLVYVGRRNETFKLAQGEFVNVSRVESTLSTSPVVHQVFVHGSSSRSFLVAVVVPASLHESTASTTHTATKEAILASFRDVARRDGLAPYEVPRDLLVEHSPFSVENGLLSDARKPQRPRLRERFGEALDALYAQVEERQVGQVPGLLSKRDSLPASEIVCLATKAVLGSFGEVLPADNFTALGGDSLSAVSLSKLLNSLYGVSIQAGAILNPTSTLASLAEHVMHQSTSHEVRPTFADLHTNGTVAYARELQLSSFLDVATVDAGRSLPAAPSEPRTVLLTGATGFLGRFLCLEWMERLAADGGTLICLVRGASNEDARGRLEAVFEGTASGLQARFDRLKETHLEVVAGDLGSFQLGLEAANWTRLAASVDRIVHAAALVNHVLPYDQLFEPNVVGTAEVARMAITTRRKAIDYVSTVAVGSESPPSALAELADIRETIPSRKLGASYANGYGVSKWAGEVVLKQLHEACGNSVSVFRANMLLSHGSYVGQANMPDMFSRLLLSVALTGMRPRSFYPAAMEQVPRFDGLPVDFSAEMISKLGHRALRGWRTFNVVSPHEDGASLDALCKWLDDAGLAVREVRDYATWLARFEEGLRSLPAESQRASFLPLIHSARERFQPSPLIPSEQFSGAVQECTEGLTEVPRLTPEIVEKYVQDFRAHGLLAGP